MDEPTATETPWRRSLRASVAAYFVAQVAMQLYVVATHGGSPVVAVAWALTFVVVAVGAAWGRFVVVYVLVAVLLGLLGVGTVVFAVQLTDVPRIYQPQYAIPRGILYVVALSLCVAMVGEFLSYRERMRAAIAQSSPLLPPPSQLI